MIRLNLIILLFLKAFSLIAQENFNVIIEQQREDFHIFKTTLTQCHAGLYTYNDMGSLDFHFKKLEKQISKRPLEPIELIAYYSNFVSKINCAHTSVRYKHFDKMIRDHEKLNSLFYYCNNKLLSKKNYFEDNIKFDSDDEVLEINNIPIYQIKDSLFNYISSDGNNLTFKEKRLKNNFFTFYALYAPKETTLEFKYIHKNDTIQSLIDLKDFFYVEKFKTKKTAENALTFEIIPVKNTALLVLPKPLPKGRKYNKKITRIISKLNETNIENLVIDLRDNLGGKTQEYLLGHLVNENTSFSSWSSKPIHKATYKKHFIKKYRFQFLASNLAGRLRVHDNFINPKEQFKGRLYVIVNGYTGSAASNLASNLKELSNGIIVGEETGGGHKNWNTGGVILKLPNSKILVSVPNIKGTNIVKSDYSQSGVVPHLKIDKNCLLTKKLDNYFLEIIEQQDNIDGTKPNR